MTTVVFAHGKESGPDGAKIRALSDVARTADYAAVSHDFRDLADPDQRADRLVSLIRPLTSPPILVGSSMGGYACLMAATSVPVRGLFLLAPAIGLPGYRHARPPMPSCPVEITHGWKDDAVMPENVFSWAAATHATLHLVDDGHRLSGNLPWLAETFARFLARLDEL